MNIARSDIQHLLFMVEELSRQAFFHDPYRTSPALQVVTWNFEGDEELIASFVRVSEQLKEDINAYDDRTDGAATAGRVE
jgi:hypothetical protein